MSQLNTHPIEARPGWFEQYLPAPAAIKRIKSLRRNRETKKSRSVFLTIDQRGYTDPTHYFPINGTVKVGARAAIRFVTDAHKNLTERGAHVKLVWCDTCLFVG